MTADRHKELLQTYMYVFDAFATDKSEVAWKFGISPSVALTRLKKLEEAGLISRYSLTDIGGGMVMDSDHQAKSRDGLFKELTWQANQTYDDYSREDALVNFLMEIPHPTGEFGYNPLEIS